MHRKIRYDLSKFPGCVDGLGQTVTAFTIRTTDGEDENYASKRAEATGRPMAEELIAFSMVSYEIQGGEIVTIKHPFEGFGKWSSKLRSFVVGAWKRLATPDETEFADFFASGTDAA